jgi:hypothetical protein
MSVEPYRNEDVEFRKGVMVPCDRTEFQFSLNDEIVDFRVAVSSCAKDVSHVTDDFYLSGAKPDVRSARSNTGSEADARNVKWHLVVSVFLNGHEARMFF